MNALNVIKTEKFDNCILHICDNSFAKTSKEEKQIWEEFSKKAYELCTKQTKEGVLDE